MANITEITVNDNTYDIKDKYGVRFSETQTLTTAQQAQARQNIGALCESDLDGMQESIVQQVIAALGTPVFGTVDENNNIILTGELANGTYTFKYEDADGNVTDIGTLTASGDEPTYTNMLLQAVDSDGQLYNGGTGWKDGYRLNSSAVETADEYADVTGFIPAKWGDTLYLSGVTMTPDSANPSKTYIYLYDSSRAHINGPYFRGDSNFESTINAGGITLDDNGMVKSIKLDLTTYTTLSSSWSGDTTAYVRFSCDQITNESIVTVNEPIS